ncbi:hypothetical protein LIA77_10397 [Sarocladium implicatum]|nr:hypothetical protein LIA77_10397 [Sarocladium implicatum]
MSPIRGNLSEPVMFAGVGSAGYFTDSNSNPKLGSLCDGEVGKALDPRLCY